MKIRPAALLPLAAALAGCGYTGGPLPPALMIPVAVADLTGFQRGGLVLLRFTIPQKTTEDLVLKTPPEMEVRAGPNPGGSFDLDRWFAASERLPARQISGGRMEVHSPAEAWAGKEMVFAVRAIGPKDRPAEWSNLLVLRIVPLPPVPGGVRASGAPHGVLIEWRGPGNHWRVWRSAGQGEPVAAAEVGEPRYLDSTAEFDATYSYSVQQLVPTGTAPAESEISPAVAILYQDRFAPPPPAQLTAIAGLGAIELNWDRASEPDWKAFQVWRGVDGGPLERLGGPIGSSSYSDRSAQSGKRYRYAVSSIDAKGNESPACAPAEITAP